MEIEAKFRATPEILRRMLEVNQLAGYRLGLRCTPTSWTCISIPTRALFAPRAMPSGRGGAAVP